MTTATDAVFYEQLMDLFYERLFEFARQRIVGAVNREYSPDDVVATTLRTLLRRDIHRSPRLQVVTNDVERRWTTMMIKTVRIRIDGDQVSLLSENDGTTPSFTISEQNGHYLLRTAEGVGIELNSAKQSSTSVGLRCGDTFRILGHNVTFLFDDPHLPDELWPLLVTVASRKIAKVQRRKFSHLFVNESALLMSEEFTILTQIGDDLKSHRQATDRELRSEAIRSGFARIAEISPGRLTRVLEMRLNGMSNEQIASEFGLSTSRVKQLLKKIRSIIADAIEESLAD